MKYKYILLVFSSLVFSFEGVHSQTKNPFFQSVSPRYAAMGPGIETLLKGATEVTSSRTPFTSTYKTRSGQIICLYSSQIVNYPDATGKLEPINIVLHSDSRGWEVNQQPNPCYFHSDRSTAISLGNGTEVGFNINSSINGSAFDESITSIERNSISLNLSTGINKKITFFTNSIETDYTIDKPIGNEINISEGLAYPSGYQLMRDDARGRETNNGWMGDYILVSTQNNSEVVARFHAPLCYDSKGNWCVGNYSTKIEDGKTVLVTSVPSSWLTNAVYPIVIDPLVIGPTAKWTGGSIPSCLFPSFSRDSIRVTIPAKITITKFLVNYAYETNGNVPVYLTDGKFYFSNSCRNNRSDTLSCDRDPGNRDFMPGYCFLDTGADFHCFLTSCYQPSCDSQSFYFTVHLSRLAGGSGCDTNWVWYSKYLMYPYYQFMASIVGNTVQPDSTSPVIITPTAQCSDICSLKMQVNVGYGVPPYKISHPWDSVKYTTGSYSVSDNCTSKGTATLTLKIPKCPTYCGQNDSLTVPPPLVIDACGDTARGWPVTKVLIKATPKVVAGPDTVIVCSGAPLKYKLTSCVSGTSISWTGPNNSSGTGDISNIALDTSASNPDTVVYKYYGIINGCSSDTNSAIGIINPYPIVLVAGVDTISVGTSVNLSISGGGTYSWLPTEGLSCTNCPNPIATPPYTTTYYATVTNSQGCSWVDSIRIVVLENQIIVPNVITPNGDGINDFLVIKGLEYYHNSAIHIYDRWGKEVYSSTNYLNDWDGGDQSDGVYYYVLTLNTGKKYQGFFQIIK